MKPRNIRSTKTRQQLFTTYVKMLQHMPHDAITVQMLTSEAGINRVTFYKHFHQLVQFQEELTLHYILELYEFMKPLNHRAYEKGFEYEALVKLLTHIKVNREIYHTLFTSPNSPYFSKQLLTFFQARLMKHTEELAKFDFPGTGVDPVIVAWYGTSALFGTIIMWAQSDFHYSPEMLAKSCIQLAPPTN